MRKRQDVWLKDISPENAGLLAKAIRKGISMAEAKQKGAVMEEERRGTVVDVLGSGGIITLVMMLESGKIEKVKAENAPTVRALIAIFGREICEGHTLVVDRVKGLEFAFDTDDLGLLAYIDP